MAPLAHVVGCLVLYAAPAVARIRNAFARGAPPQPYDFGSGAFGTWVEDDAGGPAYSYTLDQLTDPRATYNSSVDPFFRLPNDHLFHLGNDRIVALSSNFGYISVRSDEGGPKMLNDFFPQSGSQFGGGVGWLTASSPDGEGLVLSSLFNHTGGAPVPDPACPGRAFERRFGVGYIEKRVGGCSAGGAAARVSHEVVVPFGSDPVAVSIVTITNEGAAPADFVWTEAWAAAWCEYRRVLRPSPVTVTHRSSSRPHPLVSDHLDILSRELQYNGTAAAASAFASRARPQRPRSPGSGVSSYFADFRAFVAEHYSPSYFAASAGGGAPFAGVSASYSYDGLSAADEAEFARVQAHLAAEAATSAFVGPIQADLPAGASLWDASPASVALLDVSTDGGDAEVGSDCLAYFGAGGSRNPSGALNPLPPMDPPPPLSDGCLLARRRVRGLAPGASAVFAFVWSAITPREAAAGVTAQALASKYAAAARDGTLRRATTAAFLEQGYRFSLPHAPPGPWVEREVLWHSFMAHAALTYDDFFNETSEGGGGGAAQEWTREACGNNTSAPVLPRSSRPGHYLQVRVRLTKCGGEAPFTRLHPKSIPQVWHWHAGRGA